MVHVLGLDSKTRLISPCGRTKKDPSLSVGFKYNFLAPRDPLLIYHALRSLHQHQIFQHAMTPQYFRNLPLILELFVVIAQCAHLNYSGEALTTRFWDCCKPSCAWNGKADVSKPVLSCTADDKPTDMTAGTGCGTGGTAFQCSNQQPWAINDTVSYGFAGAFITSDLTHGGIEGAWCCACYQLDFTSDPLRGKSLIVQASNTAYDVTSTNRFSLAVGYFKITYDNAWLTSLQIPGGNTTSPNACAQQYGVSQTVFGQNNVGVSKKEDCQNLPEPLRAGCTWRFDWFKDASYPRYAPPTTHMSFDLTGTVRTSNA